MTAFITSKKKLFFVLWPFHFRQSTWICWGWCLVGAYCHL